MIKYQILCVLAGSRGEGRTYRKCDLVRALPRFPPHMKEKTRGHFPKFTKNMYVTGKFERCGKEGPGNWNKNGPKESRRKKKERKRPSNEVSKRKKKKRAEKETFFCRGNGGRWLRREGEKGGRRERRKGSGMRTLHVNGPPKGRRNSPFHFALLRRMLVDRCTLVETLALHAPAAALVGSEPCSSLCITRVPRERSKLGPPPPPFGWNACRRHQCCT